MTSQYAPPSAPRASNLDSRGSVVRGAPLPGAQNALDIGQSRDGKTPFTLSIVTLHEGLDLMATPIAPGNVPAKASKSTLDQRHPRVLPLLPLTVRTTL